MMKLEQHQLVMVIHILHIQLEQLLAIACLQETKRMELNVNAGIRGKQIFDAVNKLKDKYDIIGDVRGGHGLMTALEFVSDKATKTPLDNASMAKNSKNHL